LKSEQDRGVVGRFVQGIRPIFFVAFVRVTIQEICKTLIGKIRGKVQCVPLYVLFITFKGRCRLKIAGYPLCVFALKMN
jgi:hypothetical protein